MYGKLYLVDRLLVYVQYYSISINDKLCCLLYACINCNKQAKVIYIFNVTRPVQGKLTD